VVATVGGCMGVMEVDKAFWVVAKVLLSGFWIYVFWMIAC